MGVKLVFVEEKLDESTMHLAEGYSVVCIFVNDNPGRRVIQYLKEHGTGLVALRCVGFDRVDLETCKEVGISVAHVPIYSPNAVAEHAVAITMALNRRLFASSRRISGGDFSLSSELLGFDMVGKTVGLLGTGNIGRIAGKIFIGFGCKILCHDVSENKEFAALPGVTYASLDEVVSQADILSLHLPLLPSTRYIIDEKSLGKMKKGSILINSSRGGLVDTAALLRSLRSGHLRAAGLDVYENESKYFFEASPTVDDEMLKELVQCPDVLLTAHQAFFTAEALSQIARVTLQNVREFIVEGKTLDKMTNTVIKMN